MADWAGNSRLHEPTLHRDLACPTAFSAGLRLRGLMERQLIGLLSRIELSCIATLVWVQLRPQRPPPQLDVSWRGVMGQLQHIERAHIKSHPMKNNSAQSFSKAPTKIQLKMNISSVLNILASAHNPHRSGGSSNSSNMSLSLE
jgi:hypothetical protein